MRPIRNRALHDRVAASIGSLAPFSRLCDRSQQARTRAHARTHAQGTAQMLAGGVGWRTVVRDLELRPSAEHYIRRLPERWVLKKSNR